MSLIRVWTDIGTAKPANLIARITKEHADGTYTIQYFSPTNDRDHGRVVYRYEDDTYEIDDESVTEYLNTNDESIIGFVSIGEDMWVREMTDSDDEDYVPSDEDQLSDEESADEESGEDNDDEYQEEEYYDDDDS
jgi:hypothetical protein